MFGIGPLHKMYPNYVKKTGKTWHCGIFRSVGSSNSLILIFYSCRSQWQTIWFRFRINLIDCCENNQYNYKRLLLISPGGRKDRPTTLLMILNYKFLVKSIFLGFRHTLCLYFYTLSQQVKKDRIPDPEPKHWKKRVMIWITIKQDIQLMVGNEKCLKWRLIFSLIVGNKGYVGR
jgi:hypothetical protein